MKLSAEEALGNKQEYLELLGEIADLRLEMGDVDEAIKVADKALAIVESQSP